jgi:ribonuclease BN (tRNA processing enzyme)
MKVKILGCSGGIGGSHLRTTSMLVDHDILIDAGTGVGELGIAELASIDHVFITHSHLDHIAFLPFILDAVGDMRTKPLIMYATQATQDIIKAHIFNWSIWPDFSRIPTPDNPYLRFRTIELGENISLGKRKITALPATHTVPAVGYCLDGGDGSLAFTGDTTINDDFWREVNKISSLRYLIIETAFSNSERQLAVISKHLCPSMLEAELLKLERTPEIFITHLKPGRTEITMQEIQENIGKHAPRMLQNNQVFEL